VKDEKLTAPNFWESYWEKGQKTSRNKPSLCVLEILKAFEKHLPADKTMKALEVGGAMGEYLLYLSGRFGYEAHSLDYSRIGNEQTLENFGKAGMPVTVYERDLFADNSDLPKFDLVFSLGLIEHFEDPIPAISGHLRLLKPGGLLLLGVPNYSGIYSTVLKRLAPSMFKTHNMKVMDLRNWDSFETGLNLERVYRAYIGGFEPLNMKKIEVRTPFNSFIYFLTQVLTVMLSFNFSFLRKINSPFISSYLIGIYKKQS
jgi:SAM-dependent methyltransferase